MTLLAPTLTLRRDETPTGFIARLAALHETTARIFCTDLDLNLQAIAQGDRDALEALATLSGACPDVLARNAFTFQEDGYRLRNQRVTLTTKLWRHIVRVCPACVANDISAAPEIPAGITVHERIAWQIEHMRACPHHNLELVKLTEVGHGQLHDFARAISNAEDLAKLPHIKCEASRLETYLTGRLEGEPDKNTWLDQLDFAAAARTCEIIGAVALYGRRVKLRALSESEWRAAGDAGFEIAKDGEDSIRAFLTRLQESYVYNRSAGKEAGQAIFGQFYVWLNDSGANAACDPVRDIMRRHIIATMPVGAGDIVLGAPVEKRLIHSVHSASREFGAHPKRLRKILALKGLIPADNEHLSDNYVTFDAAQAHAVHDAGVIDGLSLTELESYSGAGRVQALILVRAGIIKPVVASTDDIGTFSFARKDVDEFLERIMEDAQPVYKPRPNQVPIAKAAKRAVCPSAVIVQMILDRELDWVGFDPSKEKYAAILVDSDEIRRRTTPERPDTLTLNQVKKRLNSSWQVVNKLVEHGILKTVTREKGRAAVAVPIEEFERFRNTYIGLLELAEAKNAHWVKLKRQLEKKGISPAFDPNMILATFYERTTVE